MEVKKSPKADLENKRSLFLEIGLAITLALVLLAFEWKVDSAESNALVEEEVIPDEEEIIPVTTQELKAPPPPPPPAPKITDVLEIVDDEEEIEDELEIQNDEADQDEEIEIQVVEEEEEEEEDEAQVFVVVEDMPEYPGGLIGLQKWINKNVRYPVIAQENGITGRVFVTFVVNKQGKVEQAKIVRGVDPSLDKEALRVINKMMKWKPGKQRGKAVKVSFTVPINFQLQ